MWKLVDLLCVVVSPSAMSCEEEEDSSMDEDDDMPGLESVSSSEVSGMAGIKMEM